MASATPSSHQGGAPAWVRPHDGGNTRSKDERRLIAALAIAAGVAAFEVGGGIFGNSLALLADAGHVGTDALALGVSAWAAQLSRRSHTKGLTFGYHRGEVIAAFANSVSLFAVAILVLSEAARRAQSPPSVDAPLVLVVGVGGLAANLVMAALLNEGKKRSLNVKSAFLHVLGDILASVAVVAGAIAVALTGLNWIDPALGAFIGLLILGSAARLARETLRILMEAVPRGIMIDQVAGEILAVEGVRQVHDLHAWTLTSGMLVLTGHVVVEDQPVSQVSAVLAAVRMRLAERFGIEHATLEVEPLTGGLLKPGTGASQGLDRQDRRESKASERG